jgi:predicted ester cyclase
MQNFLSTLFAQYNVVSNNANLVDKVTIIRDTFSLNEENIQLFFIGILYDFIKTQPQYYFNRDVENEVFENLNTLYLRDNEIFSKAFFEQQNNLFNAINLYHHILETYNELDDVAFDESTKIKIYYLPIITQLMEFCLNHLYRFVLYIEDDFVAGKDYKKQNKLGPLKESLNKLNYKFLTNIDIDFRNAISHGQIELNRNEIIYSYKEQGTREEVFKTIKSYELEEIKNNLLDIASGCILGIIKVLMKNNVINEGYLSAIDVKMTQEYVKLFLHNENIRVKTFSKGIIGTTQLNIHIDIKNINDTNQIIHLLVLIGKILYIVFPEYERYFINYTHPYSIGGMISFENAQLHKMSKEESVTRLDDYLSKESAILIPDIQNTNVDNRSYKFQVFPKIYGTGWEVVQIKDISLDGIKRYDAKILVEDCSITKEAVEKLLFQAVSKIRVLENKSNPITKIKCGSVEADVVCMSVFLKSNERKRFALLKSNQSFIFTVNYYKSKSVPKIQLGFQDNYLFEQLKKFDIYWNVNFINRLTTVEKK